MYYEIKWNKGLDSYFMYGSKLSFFKEDDEVHFENKIMSPGVVIVQWNSNPKCKHEKFGFSLPNLQQGTTYKLKPDVISYPEHSVALKINMFDHEDNLIQSLTISERGGIIQYNKSASYYTIELVSVGVKAFCFKRISIIQEEK